MSAPHASETSVTLAGRYALRRQIAGGGMGVVWEASDTVLERPVAIKVLSASLAGDERFLERFRREARAAAGLTHPNVAQVYDYGEDGATRFIVLELLRGETLAARLQREGRLPPAEAAAIGAQTADALEAAHRAGIVHRDVKPGNIMLTTDGGVKVMDFGIAAAAHDTSLTATGSLLGTAIYMSPEHASGKPATPASDVYALAVVMYEALTGTPPFDMESPVATAAAHVHTAPAPIAGSATGVPAPLAAAVERGLAKDPAARPASAAAFAGLLRAGAGGESASTPTVHLRTQRTDPLPTPEAAAATTTLPRRTARPGSPRRQANGRRWAIAAAIVILGLLVWALVSAATGGESLPPSAARSPAQTSPSKASPPPPALPAIPGTIVGMRQDDAVRALSNLGIAVDSVVRVHVDKEQPDGVVTAITPPPGSRVGPDTRVILFVTDSPGHGHKGPGGDEGGHHGDGPGHGGGPGQGGDDQG